MFRCRIIKTQNSRLFSRASIPSDSHDAIPPRLYLPSLLINSPPPFNRDPGYHPGNILEFKMLVVEF